MTWESELDMVSRHVREGQARVIRQGDLVAKLAKARHDTTLAKALLAVFVDVQDTNCAHLARIVARG